MGRFFNRWLTLTRDYCIVVTIGVIVFNLIKLKVDPAMSSSPPPNFSWVDPEKLAAMAFPKSPSNLNWLVQQNIKHLVTLSPEKIPPVDQIQQGQLQWTLIEVEEFEAPSLEDIMKFIKICEENHLKNEAVGVHCRQGWGRTGVMVACYMVYFYNIAPQTAIANLRLQRPGSVETYEQEKIVSAFRDYLRTRHA